MSLRELCINVLEAKGLLHQIRLRELRDYLRRTPEKDLIREIRDIIEVPQLKALWEAGLSAPLQQAVLEQLERVA